MLRITIHEKPEYLTVQLEGRLSGPWVQELENWWQNILVGQQKPVLRFDLTGLTFVDAAGRAFLAARHATGAELVACGCLMRAYVAEITNADLPECGPPLRGSDSQS